jgi:hypothetical protein
MDGSRNPKVFAASYFAIAEDGDLWTPLALTQIRLPSARRERKTHVGKF